MNLYDILMSEDIKKSINDNLDELLKLIPELKYIINFDHKHPHHHLDVWEHTLYALSLSEEDIEIRLALLLHDIGKPFCYTEENGIRHFYGHNELSYKMSKNILYRLGYDEYYTNRISYLILKHDLPIQRREIKKNYELESKRYEVQRCDSLAHNPNYLDKRLGYLSKIEKKLLKYKK